MKRTPPDIHLYRFHPETGEDARKLLEPDFPRPEGLTDEAWKKGHEHIQTAKAAGWLPYWEKRGSDVCRVFDANVAFVAGMTGQRVHKHEVPPALNP